MDYCTFKEEVAAAVARDKGEMPKVSLLAANAREQRKTVVELDEGTALKLITRSRIKIGWVRYCMRCWTEVQHCLRYLGYGHK